MSATRWKTSFVLTLFLGLLLATIASVWLFQEDEYRRIKSPDGKYTALITYPRYMSMLPMFPGGGGDKEGFIRIVNSQGKNFGKIPVSMVWMSQDLEWSSQGAYLKLVGEWDFRSREYRYWNEAQTKEIVRQAR